VTVAFYSRQRQRMPDEFDPVRKAMAEIRAYLSQVTSTLNELESQIPVTKPGAEDDRSAP
jgi:hypothetical protein